jgi:hypothetical protein
MGYTLGWPTEVFIKRSLTYEPKMFKRGLYFTKFWFFVLTTIWVIIATFDIVKKLFCGQRTNSNESKLCSAR